METALVKKLLNDERQLLNQFFDTIDVDQLVRLVDTVKKCEGMIVLSGVGKSGLVAEKIAMTLTSTGSRALFLSPINALHGDVGIVTEKDVFILISKSGESDELLNLIPALRNKKVKLIAWTSNAKSRLVKACDEHVDLPFEKELCPHNFAPTISTSCQLIVGDMLAVALMHLKNFSIDDFARNHPAGRIGRRINFRVKDLMITDGQVPLCRPEDTLGDILVNLSNKQCGCILIVDNAQTLLGIFTDGDLRRALQKHGPQALSIAMDQLMTLTPRTIGPDELAAKALSLMEDDQKRPITTLAVVDESNKVLGLIKMHDIVQTGL